MDTYPESRLPLPLAPSERAANVAPGERRRRARAEVHWLVVFAEPVFDAVLQTVTHDVSSSGFYCVVNATFIPGRTHECTLVVPAPTHSKPGCQSGLLVHCKVRVSRVVAGDGGISGVAFQIEDYRLRRSAIEPGNSRHALGHPTGPERN